MQSKVRKHSTKRSTGLAHFNATMYTDKDPIQPVAMTVPTGKNPLSPWTKC